MDVKCDQFGNKTYESCVKGVLYSDVLESDFSQSEFYSSLFVNSYDERGNLVAVKQKEHSADDYWDTYIVHDIRHYYDDVNRRARTDEKKMYDGLKECEISYFSYGKAYHEGEPLLLSIISDLKTIEDFSPTKFEYEVSDHSDFHCGKAAGVLCYTTAGASVKDKSFDPISRILTITVVGAGYDQDSTQMNTYVVHLDTAEAYITDLVMAWEPVDSFSYDKYEYDFSASSSWSWDHFYYTFGAEKEIFFDTATNIMTITVYGESNPDKKRVYTIVCPNAPESYMTSLSFNGIPFKDFSFDKYEYDLGENYYYWDLDIDYTLSDAAHAYASYDQESQTLSLEVRNMNNYGDYMHTYVFHHILYQRPCYLTSLSIGGMPVEDFSPEKYEYDLPDSFDFSAQDTLTYTSTPGSYVDYTYIRDSLRLKVNVYYKRSSSYELDRSYHFNFKRPLPQPFISSMSIVNDPHGSNKEIVPIDTFSCDKYHYDFSSFYYISYHYCEIELMVQGPAHDSSLKLLTWDMPPRGCVDEVSYDSATGVVSIRVKGVEYDYDAFYSSLFGNEDPDSSLMNVYTIATKRFPPRLLSLYVDGFVHVISAEDEILSKWDIPYYPGIVSYELPNGIVAEESLDYSTTIYMITLTYADRPTDASLTTRYRFQFKSANGVPNVWGDQAKLFVEGRTICADGFSSSVSVYDVSGRLVGTGSGESIRILVSQAGVYVVMSNGKTAKVVVE